MLRQRLRGLLGTTITACIPWTALGFVTGVVLQFDLIPGMSVHLVPNGIIGMLTIAGAVVGIVNGLAFSALLFATERGKTVDNLGLGRFAAWGAIATAGTMGMIFTSLTAAAIGGVVGAVAAVGTLAAARRARLTTTQTPSLTA